jgi:hypothetical protein
MNRTLLCGALAVALALTGISPAGAQGGQKTLAATLDVYVFPSAGQDAGQQNKDEAECYQWAVNNTGSDPFSIQKQQAADTQQAQAAQQQASQAGQGAGAKGAVRGAAVGALVGEIADDDAGKGAAYGAAVGVVAGRRRGREQQQQAQAQVQAQSQQTAQASQQQIDNFKKAFSVCLESKNYMVKF